MTVELVSSLKITRKQLAPKKFLESRVAFFFLTLLGIFQQSHETQDKFGKVFFSLAFCVAFENLMY